MVKVEGQNMMGEVQEEVMFRHVLISYSSGMSGTTRVWEHSEVEDLNDAFEHCAV